MTVETTAILLAMGIGDAFAGGLAGTPTTTRSSCIGAMASTATWLAARQFLGTPCGLAEAMLVLPLLWIWVGVRRVEIESRLLRVTVSMIAITAMGFLISPAVLSQLAEAAAGPAHEPALPVQGTWLLVAIALFQGPTANGIVRVVLDLADIDISRSKSKLRGGRYIGLFERWLIVGLASFDLTAAALVVSAKSLLRFPELSSAANGSKEGEPDLAETTEYFLLGSLVSWTLALGSVGLLRLAH